MAEKKQESMNMITALMVSEILKPGSMKMELPLSQDFVGMVRNSMSSIGHVYRNVQHIYSVVGQKTSTESGISASGKTHSEVEFGLSSDEDIENRINHNFGDSAGGALALFESKVTSKFNTERAFLARITETCYEMMERICRESESGKQVSISVFDAERLSRYLGILGQPIMQQIFKDDPQYMMQHRMQYHQLLELAQHLDAPLIRNPYVVSRRLVMKYGTLDTLEELDGFLKYNVITGQISKLSFLKNMKRVNDPATGVEMFAPSGILDFIGKMTNVNIKNGTTIWMTGGREIDVGFSNGDARLMAEALMSIPALDSYPGYSYMSLSPQTAARLSLLMSSLGMGREAEARMSLEKKLRCLKDAEVKAARDPVGMNRFCDNPQAEGDLKTYKENHRIWIDMKQMILDASININWNEDPYEKNPDMFPYRRAGSEISTADLDDTQKDVSCNPFTDMNIGNKMTAITDNDSVIMRLNALPTGMIDQTLLSGARILADIGKLKKEAYNSSMQNRKEVSQFLSQTPEEVRAKLEKALEGMNMSPTGYGWFNKKFPERQEAISTAARKALVSMSRSESAVTIAEAAFYLIDSESRPLQVYANEQELHAEQRERNLMMENSNVCTIDPPKEKNDACAFALLTNSSVSANVDGAVPKAAQAYYNDPGFENREHYIEDLCSKLRLENKNTQRDAISAYTTLKNMIKACDEGRIYSGEGGVSEAHRIMEECENRMRKDFIDYYVQNFTLLKSSYAACYQELDEEKHIYLSDVYTASGAKYGDRILRRLASDILQRAGYSEEAGHVMDCEPEEMSANERYVCSLLATAVSNVSYRFISKDLEYAIRKNEMHSRWNSRTDLVGLKGDSSYYALYKGTVPIFMNDLMDKEIRKELGEYTEEIEKVAAIPYEEYRQRGIEMLGELFKKVDDRNAVELGQNPGTYDAGLHHEMVLDLKELLNNWDFESDDPKKEALGLLDMIESNAPALRQPFQSIRNLLESPTLKRRCEELRNAYSLIVDNNLEYMSEESRQKTNLSEKTRLDKDAAWGRGMNAEEEAKHILNAHRNTIPADARARIAVAIADTFSAENSVTQMLMNLIPRNCRNVQDYDTLKSIVSSVCSELESCTVHNLQVRVGECTKNLGQNGILDVNVKTATPSYLPIAPLITSFPDIEGTVLHQTMDDIIINDILYTHPELAYPNNRRMFEQAYSNAKTFMLQNSDLYGGIVQPKEKVNLRNDAFIKVTASTGPKADANAKSPGESSSYRGIDQRFDCYLSTRGDKDHWEESFKTDRNNDKGGKVGFRTQLGEMTQGLRSNDPQTRIEANRRYNAWMANRINSLGVSTISKMSDPETSKKRNEGMPKFEHTRN